ncbi:hypothetical protein ACFSUK_11885 [Sphingobium scionense]
MTPVAEPAPAAAPAEQSSALIDPALLLALGGGSLLLVGLGATAVVRRRRQRVEAEREMIAPIETGPAPAPMPSHPLLRLLRAPRWLLPRRPPAMSTRWSPLPPAATIPS